MVRTTRQIRDFLRSVDIVIEVVDARIARSGRNPLLDALAAKQTRVIALNREDLANPATTKRWLDELTERGATAVAVEGRRQGSAARIAVAVTASESRRARGVKVSRAMIVGIPNSGKSAIVNALLRRGAAKTENRAGVTRQMQWFRLAPNVEVMDTPGVLPPKIRSAAAQWKLAICGAVPRDRYDPTEVVGAFHRWLLERTPRTNVPDLQSFAAGRGFRKRGGEVDYHNAAQSYISAFNEGAFGRISLESPDDTEAA
jgi:ribosome biogenesis GTPase A